MDDLSESTLKLNNEVNDVLEEPSDEVEDSISQDICTLLQFGLLPDDIERIRAHGIYTMKGVEMASIKELLTIQGLNSDKIEKIKSACKEVSFEEPFMTAAAFYEKRMQIFKISTGSQNLNELLEGGIEAMTLTEVYGENGTGKTQLAHTLCVTAQMPGPNGYMGGNVIFLDTENSFRPERVKSIAKRFNLNETTVLQNVLYSRVFNSEHQYDLLNKVANKLNESPGLFKLLIVDSIISLFRVEFVGDRNLLERQQKLGRVLSRLQKLSEEYNIAVLITNQITLDVKNLINPIKSSGGNILSHAAKTRILFTNIDSSRKVAKLCSSPHLKSTEVTFKITSGGIDDLID